MREIFYEESAINRNVKSSNFKYTVLNVFSIASWVLLFVWVFIAMYQLELLKGNIALNVVVALVPVAMFVASGIIFGRMKNRFCVDYDYAFVSGEIRVSKVIKASKRKPVMVFSTVAIEKIGKFGSDTFNTYINMKGVKRYIFTSNNTPDEGKSFYYIVINQGEKKLLIFECTQALIVNILKYTKMTVVEKDFK